ncbi:MAG: aspartate kinase [Clostridiales bacterium]|nr:aspartate kinase [Clostridiales bacterium]
MLIVQKFGGSSVANADRVKNVAARIAESAKTGARLVVALSAQGDTTDELIAKAQEISPKPSKREIDMLLATGEQQSVALMAMALHEIGVQAVSLNGDQAGIKASATHSNARINRISPERIVNELNQGRVVLVAGFQGINRYGDVTTLGRGGSDTTAVALAAALDADLCEIYTDVDGVYTADPRVVKNARKISAITYDEMLELASMGAGVLHNRSVELAKKFDISLVVRSSMTREEGTLIRKDSIERTLITGVAIDKDAALISIIGVENAPGMAYRVFGALAAEKISIDIILQSVGRDGAKDISFTVSRKDLPAALETLAKNKERIDYDRLTHEPKIAKLSIVGAGMESNPGVAANMFEALYNGAVNINMISTSEIKISVLIDEKDAERAANIVHDHFLSKENLNLEIFA